MNVGRDIGRTEFEGSKFHGSLARLSFYPVNPSLARLMTSNTDTANDRTSPSAESRVADRYAKTLQYEHCHLPIPPQPSQPCLLTRSTACSRIMFLCCADSKTAIECLLAHGTPF